MKIYKVFFTLLFLGILGFVFYQGRFLLKEEQGMEVVKDLVLELAIRESRYYDGIEYMIEKLYVEEGIQIELQLLPDQQANTILQTMIQTGNVPDIIEYQSPDIYGLLNPPMDLVCLSHESFVERLTTEQLVEYSDGEIYAMPLQESEGLGGIIYNEQLFRKFGLEEPQNYEEFIQLCERLKLEGIDPIGMCSDYRTTQLWMDYSYCFANVSDEQRSGMEVETLAPMLDEYLNLFSNSYVTDKYLYTGYGEFIDNFAEGRVGMVMGNFHILAEFSEMNSELELAMFPLPFAYNVNAEYVIAASAMSLLLPKEGDNIELAKLVLDHFSSEEYLGLLYQDFSMISAYEDIDKNSLDKDLISCYQNYLSRDRSRKNYNYYHIEDYRAQSSSLWLYYMDPQKQQLGATALLEEYNKIYESEN